MNVSRNLIQFNIDPEVSEKFQLALMLNKEDSDDVIEKLIRQYVAESFSLASKTISIQDKKKATPELLISEDFGKANRKIPAWARKPQQNNHRIIRAFFELSEESGSVTVEELSERCSNVLEYPETFVTDFKGNFAQMKTDASNSHGKVFITNGNEVEIWDEIKHVLMTYKKHFVGDYDGASNRNKITTAQIISVYHYAKKAYLGEISSPKAADKVYEESGMNRNSAQRSIYVLKNMLNGEAYKSILGEEQTRYYFEMILTDFGKDKLRLAIQATEMHINYREEKFHTNVFGLRQVVDDFKMKID